MIRGRKLVILGLIFDKLGRRIRFIRYAAGRFMRFGDNDNNGIFALQRKMSSTKGRVKDGCEGNNGFSEMMKKDAVVIRSFPGAFFSRGRR